MVFSIDISNTKNLSFDVYRTKGTQLSNAKIEVNHKKSIREILPPNLFPILISEYPFFLSTSIIT